MSREAEVFADAVGLPACDRMEFLDRICSGDAALRVRVDALLLAHDRAGAFLPTPQSPTRLIGPMEKRGEEIAHYKLLEVIGEGGCGVVWLAEQGEPLRRHVAIKVIKLGMDTKEVIARFDAERHALALMDHPNIARVFDAGATATGRPFFAMELVRGPRLTEYCDANRLTTAARLALFVQVCRAIQHAHLKGIIHRDIKPSNILVASHDGIAVPKVIDFGIAKATAGHLTDHTLYTAVEQMIGTPVYMSPEQVEPAGHDIDTRSDIYSLGVLLYELLSGRPPFDPKTLAEAGLAGLRRVIRESDPARPSTRLSTLNQKDRDTIARQRGTEPQQLVKQLRGDLDWIVMRCLEKNRTRRYETASDLARDVEHYLHHEPVSARPPGTLYRWVKLAARHKVLTASLATATTMLVLVAAGATGIAIRARRAERAEAQQSSRTDVTLGSRLIEEGKVSEGLAFLVRAAASDPDNHGIGPRLLSVLAYRSFPRPIGRPLAFVGVARDVAYSADGRQVCTFTTEGSWVWNRADGSRQHWGGSNAVIWSRDWVGHISSDFQRVAAGGIGGSIHVWATDTGREILPPLPHAGTVNNVFFSPDDRWLATADQLGSVKIWDAATGALQASPQHDLPSGEMIAMAGLYFSPDSKRLLVTTQGAQWGLWRVPEGEPVFPPPHSPSLRFTGSGAFRPDGTLLVLTDAQGAQLHDAANGAPHGPRLEHEGPCRRAVFSRDGSRLATASVDQSVKLWLLSSLAKPQFVLRHGHPVQDVAFTSGDRYLLTLATDGLVRIWNTTTGELAVEPERSSNVYRFALSPDGGEFLTFGRFDSVARRWRMPAVPLAPFQLPADAKRRNVRLAYKKNEAYAIQTDRVQKLVLPSLAPVGPPWLFPPQVVPVWTGVASDGLSAFAVLGPGQCELWELRDPGIVRHALPPFPPRARPFEFLIQPGATRFATHHHESEKSTDCSVDVWNRHTGERIGPTIHPTSALRAVLDAFDFSPDERLLAFGTFAHGVEIWDVAAGKILGDSLVVPIPVSVVKFSPDGRLLAIGTGSFAVQFWDPSSRQPVGASLQHAYRVAGLEFFGDSRRLLTRTSAEVRIWDVASGNLLTPPLRPLLAPGETIVSALLREEDSLVATVTSKGRLRLYGAATGQLLLEPIQASSPGLFGFEATDRFVAVSSGPNVSVWPLPPLSLPVPVPGWLLRLATATAGGTLDRFAAFREQPADAESFDAIQREIDTLPVNAPYAAWGRWILADPATRPPSPEKPWPSSP